MNKAMEILGVVLKEAIFSMPPKNDELAHLEKTRNYIEGANHIRKGIRTLMSSIFMVQIAMGGLGLGIFGLVMREWVFMASGFGVFLLAWACMFLLTTESSWIRLTKIDEMLHRLGHTEH